MKVEMASEEANSRVGDPFIMFQESRLDGVLQGAAATAHTPL